MDELINNFVLVSSYSNNENMSVTTYLFPYIYISCHSCYKGFIQYSKQSQ